MYTARMIYDDFRDSYPELWRRGITYGICGYMTIELLIPGVGRFNYRSDTDSIICLERWEDEKEIKRKEKESRSDMYERFCDIARQYMRDNKMTHQEFADKVRISRQSLSKYLLGDSIPKVSTMRRICECIGYEL